jgi:uncharacterized membrane protein YjgN (DUF898 family)
MNIRCPECGKNHDVADTKIPANKFKASCRSCAVQFVVVVEPCPACKLPVQEGQTCLICVDEPPAPEETIDEVVKAEPDYGPEWSAPEPQSPPLPFISDSRERSSHRVQFSGRGGDFFRIWIVNLFLTIITLGIYIPWAKVRTRQYFYNHTTVAGEPFEYLADPMILLRGYLLVGGGFLLYSAFQFLPIVSGLLMLFFYVAFPFLVFKSLRFYAHNSSFRNIRFRFLGSLPEAYTTYLALPFAIPFTLGLIIPYWMYYKKKYFFENFAFGGTRCSFTAKAKPFYWFYLKAALMMLGPVFILGVIAAVVMPQLLAMSGGEEVVSDNFTNIIIGLVVLAYAALILASTFVQQYVYAKTMNYCWQEADLGSVRFVSTLVPSKLMMIQFVNILAIIASVGLLYPWAKIRRTKYVLENLTLQVSGGLDGFTAANADQEAAFGEVAMDFFDFEIGL